MSMTVMDLAVMVYHVAVIDVADIVCGRHGLAVIVYLVAVMDMLCGRHGLWPSWYRPITLIDCSFFSQTNSGY